MDARPLSAPVRGLAATPSRDLRRFAWDPYVGLVRAADVQRAMASYRLCRPAPAREGAPAQSRAGRNRRRRRREKKIPVEVPMNGPFRELEKSGKEISIFQLQRVFIEQINRLRMQKESKSTAPDPNRMHTSVEKGDWKESTVAPDSF